MALGRGIASLIGGQSEEDARDTLEQIDSMELVEGEDFGSVPAANGGGAPQSQAKASTTNVSVIEEEEADSGFEQIEEMSPTLTPPSVPPTTPLTIDQIPEDIDMPTLEPVQVKPKPESKIQEQASEKKDDDAWDTHEERVVHIPVGDIQINPNQPRRAFDPSDMAELTESIELHGILQPLVVRRVAKDTYELIAGERRLRAAKTLGWARVPCVVRVKVQGTETSLVYALIENLQREDLNPVEEAQAYERLNKEFGMTHEEIGEAMGTSRVRITNAMRVLQLPAEVMRGLSEGKITSGHAKAILMIPDPDKQILFYHHLVDEGLTVRKAEVRARRIQRAMKVDDPMRHKGRRGRHELSVKFRPFLEERYGFNADVKFLEAKNRFEVVFRAYNEAEIQDLIGRLLGEKELPMNVDDDVIGDDEDDELDEDEE